MFESIISTLHVLLSVVGLLAPDSGAVGVALVVVSTALLIAVVAALTVPAPGLCAGPHPRRAIAPSTVLAQSDPDAEGHPRPRAPGLAASAA